MTVAEPLIELRGIGRCAVSGDRSRAILHDIDLDIRAGEMVAVVGASGSGKSSLLNIIGCLDAPTSGVYRFNGQDVRGQSAAALAGLRGKHFGFVFQRYCLIPYLPVLDNVAMPGIYTGRRRKRRCAAAARLLDELGLGEQAQRMPNQLSGGQQQRVSIARALLNRPSVILADEPTGALDQTSRDVVMRVLHDLHRRGHTVIVVTHDASVAAHAQRIVEIAGGRIVADRFDRELTGDPAVADRADREVAGGRAVADRVGPPGAARWPREGMPVASRGHRSLGQGPLFDIKEAFAAARQALVSHRMRSALLVGAVGLSIAAAVSMVAIGDAAQRFVLKDISAVAPNTIEIYRGFDWGDSRNKSIRTLVQDDLASIARQPYVDSASPMSGRTLTVRYRSADAAATVMGVGPDYFRVTGLAVAQGRAFGPGEVRRQSQVALIDENTRRRFFGSGEEPVGKVLIVGPTPVTVIGVLRSNAALDRSQNLYVWLPYTTAGSKLFGETSFQGISVRLRQDAMSKDAEHRLDGLLHQRHRAKDFFTYNLDGIRQVAERTARSLTRLLTAIGAGVLFIGCVGVTNVMLVAVRERTVEIGIRIATGASRRHIAWQLGAESVIVCVAGGVLGTLGAYGFIALLSWCVSEWDFTLSGGLIALAFTCSALVGTASAGLPARRAAQLDPAAALARN